jgi:ribosomal protein S18 acetylase RimI-like enzyme
MSAPDVILRPLRPSDHATVITVIEAYIHFVGVHPGARGSGLGRRLYQEFFGVVRAHGRTVVRAVTAPVNTGSIAFHRRMGFEVEPGPAGRGDAPVAAGCDGPGQDRVRFTMYLR